MRHRVPRVPLVALALLACGEADAAIDCPAAAEGVRVAASGGAGQWDTRPHFEELWRVGGLREGQELAGPAPPALGRTGRLAIPDFQLSEVVVVEPDGAWRRLPLARGAGPGELTAPVAAGWSEAGELAVLDAGAPKVLFYSPDFAFVREQPLAAAFIAPVYASGEVLWAGLAGDGTAYIQGGLQPTGDPAARRAAITRLRPGAGFVDTIATGTVPTVGADDVQGWAVAGWPRPLAALASDGRYAVAGSDAEYRVVVHDADGAPRLQICRPHSAGRTVAQPDPPADLARLAAALAGAPRPDRVAPFGRMLYGADGRLWVQRQLPPELPDGHSLLFGAAGATHDVFAADGAWLGEATLPPRARLVGANGDTVWTFETGDLDEIEVVAYRMVK